jgi:hypothetical protein
MPASRSMPIVQAATSDKPRFCSSSPGSTWNCGGKKRSTKALAT